MGIGREGAGREGKGPTSTERGRREGRKGGKAGKERGRGQKGMAGEGLAIVPTTTDSFAAYARIYHFQTKEPTNFLWRGFTSPDITTLCTKPQNDIKPDLQQISWIRLWLLLQHGQIITNTVE